MLLKDYIPNINKKLGNIFFSGISFNSYKIKKNDIFFAIKGNKIDGNKFVSIAIKKGGSSVRDFKNIYGKKGSFQKEFNVYEREGQNCKKIKCYFKNY